MAKKSAKQEKEQKKREEKERAKREKEEKAATLKREKDLKKGKKSGFTKTTVTKIPSLSRVGQPSHLLINVAGTEQLEINVTDSHKNPVPTEVVEVEPGVMQINFTPEIVGDNEIEVKYGGQPVSGSPFTCRAYDPTRIHVGAIPNGVTDKPVHFVVDASEAGVGNLEVAVNDGRIPSMAHSLGQHRYDISFVPREAQNHTVTVRFNNEPVPGSPFICKLVSATQVSAGGPGLERIPVGELADISVVTSGEETPVVTVRDPQGNEIPAEVKPDGANKYIVQYMPRSVGNHVIEISYLNEPVTGSPFTAKAYDSKMARLDPCEGACLGQPCTFSIDAARAGAGNMEIIVSVDGRNVPNFVQAEGQARFKVSFTPQEAKEHVISVKFNGHSIPGSPMRCMVEDLSHLKQSSSSNVRRIEELTRTQNMGESIEQEMKIIANTDVAQVGLKKGFSIDNSGRGGDCNVIVTDPRGGPLSVRCFKQQDDSYWVEFTPEETGEHSIEVTFGDVPIPGSPFKCQVVDPKKVVVKGIEDRLTLRHATTIALNRREAGTKDLTIDVTDPTGKPLKVEMIKSPTGEDRATFLPNQLGPHKINIKAAGFNLPGYPQTVIVEEYAQPTVYGAAVDQSVRVNEQTSLIFDPKKTHGGLKIDVRGPNKNKVRHNTVRRPNGTSEIVFLPEEVGTYTVNIHFNNILVLGTPVEVRVVDPSKVLVNDENVDRDGNLVLQLNQRNVFDVDATAAGPGKLRAEVRDADNTLLGGGPAVEELGYGKWRVAFKPQTSGRYAIYLYWNELPVETAYPIRVNVISGGVGPSVMPTTSKYVEYTTQTTSSVNIATPVPNHKKERSSTSAHSIEEESMDHTRILLKGEGIRKAQLKQSNEFVVDGSDVPREGRLTATLIGQKADIPVNVQRLGYNVYKANYTPAIGGNYELHVLWNGRHVKGSPYQVIIQSSNTAADLISVDTSTLKIGIVNEDIKTLIDTRRAGPGQLSAQCMGPVKLAYCELYDHRDGTYTLSVRPTEVGKHTLVIKYNEEHVPGSPYLVHVSMPPDPSKVRVYGPGIEHGILSTFKSNFAVETKGAGAGQLTVRVRGPKAAFNVEMQREKKNERTIHCKYEPREPGDYQVEVKWHGEHVPGSPFLVMIVDTEQELARFLRGDAPSPQPATPFIPPGWMGPPPMFMGPQGMIPQGRGLYGPPMGPPPGAIMGPGPYGPPLQRGKKYANGY